MHVPRVERLQLDGHTVWRKRYFAQGRRLPKLLLNWFARKIGSAALLAIMPLAAEAACALTLPLGQLCCRRSARSNPTSTYG